MNLDLIRKLQLSIFTATWFWLVPVSLTASEPLNLAATKIVNEVKNHLQELSQTSIRIGKFTSALDPHDETYGRRIVLELKKVFEILEIGVDDSAAQTVEGTYSIDAGQKVILVQARITERRGKAARAFSVSFARQENEAAAVQTVQSIEPETEASLANGLDTAIVREVKSLKTQEIEEPGELLFAAGETTDGSVSIQDNYLVLNGRLGVRLKEIHPQENRSSPHFHGSIVKPSIQAPHFLLRQNASYCIELKNFKDDVHLATKILFDGVDTTIFSKEDADRGRMLWVVPMKKNVAVYGWYHTDQESTAFRMVRDEESVAKQFDALLHKGKIQVNIYAAWDPTQKNKVPREFQDLDSRSAAGQGAAILNQIKRVKLEVGTLLGEIMVEYAVAEGNSPLVVK
jgi:hypothetical protein